MIGKKYNNNRLSVGFVCCFLFHGTRSVVPDRYPRHDTGNPYVVLGCPPRRVEQQGE